MHIPNSKAEINYQTKRDTNINRAFYRTNHPQLYHSRVRNPVVDNCVYSDGHRIPGEHLKNGDEDINDLIKDYLLGWHIKRDSPEVHLLI